MGGVRHERGLVWYPDKDYGYYPVVQDGQYGEDYWKKYQEYRLSPIAERLMAARADLAEKYLMGEAVVDIGIGSGHFIETLAARRATLVGAGGVFGFDVNPLAITWLKERGLWRNPYDASVHAACTWDALEHMPDPAAFVARVLRWLFVSIPIFDGPEHVLKSKHFKPSEHIWYYGERGFLSWAGAHGFRCVESNRMETELGRDGIETFVLERTL